MFAYSNNMTFTPRSEVYYCLKRVTVTKDSNILLFYKVPFTKVTP